MKGKGLAWYGGSVEMGRTRDSFPGQSHEGSSPRQEGIRGVGR